MQSATGRHPWRPARIHVIVRAPGHRPVTTHVFDAGSEHVDSDAVFAVKPSLLRSHAARSADDPERPAGHHRPVVAAGQRFHPGPRPLGHATYRSALTVNVPFATSLEGLETVKTGSPGPQHVSGSPPVTQVTMCRGSGGLWRSGGVLRFACGVYSLLDG